MKITDSPGAMLVMPFRATAVAKEFELSSIFQPAMFTALAPVFVTSNQSAPTGLLPLDHGATSEMTSDGAGGSSSTHIGDRQGVGGGRIRRARRPSGRRRRR